MDGPHPSSHWAQGIHASRPVGTGWVVVPRVVSGTYMTNHCTRPSRRSCLVRPSSTYSTHTAVSGMDAAQQSPRALHNSGDHGSGTTRLCGCTATIYICTVYIYMYGITPSTQRYRHRPRQSGMPLCLHRPQNQTQCHRLHHAGLEQGHRACSMPLELLGTLPPPFRQQVSLFNSCM